MASATPLEREVVRLTPTDSWTGNDACQGTAIFGAPGSGKTAVVGRRLALSALEQGWGGLVLCAKMEEPELWAQYARATGRENDLIVFSATSGELFNPLQYFWHRPGRSAANIEESVEFFVTLMAVGRLSSDASTEKFWDLATQQLIRVALVLLSLANAPISIVNIDRVIASMPRRPGEFEEATWQSDSYCAALLHDIRERQTSLTADQWSDLEFATRFTCRSWPEFDERPRSSIEFTWGGMANRILFNPLNRLFCSGKCTFIPEHTTQAGKIIVCDFPILEYGHETARLANCLLKYAFQLAWLRRDVNVYPDIAFLWADECQYFILPKGRDNAFQQVCRGSRIATFYLTQSILNLAEELGEHRPGSKTLSWCGNLATKVFMQNNCVETNRYASEQIGQEWSSLRNVGLGTQSPHFGEQEAQRFRVDTDEFTRLTKPDTQNPYATAVIYQGGRRFMHTSDEHHPEGLNYLRIQFKR